MALKGIKVVEMMGLAPGPFCGTILSEFGASVTVVQKIQALPLDMMLHGKKVISIDMKSSKGVEIVKKLCATSDVLIDTFRPGVMEKLGLGPEVLMKENSRLVYARLTGYGQNGAYKSKAGHDINYTAISGFLHMLIKDKKPPSPPINFAADFAGGSVLCALGIVLALYERTMSGKGQIIDASMTEGAAYVASWLFKSRVSPYIWPGEPGNNLLDGGVPFYSCYKTKDGKFMAVGALEPQFYSEFLKGLQLSEDEFSQGVDSEGSRKKFTEVFLTKTQEEWCEIFEKLDACVTPVLDLNSVDKHESNMTRNSFYRDNNNTLVPNPAPKLLRTPGEASGLKSLPEVGQHTIEILGDLGYSKSEIENIIETGLVYAARKSNL